MEKPLKSKTVQLVTLKVYATREFMWNDLWISMDAQFNNTFVLLFGCKSRNQPSWPGDQEYIFGRSRPNVSCLRRPGPVRAEPWIYEIFKLYWTADVKSNKLWYSPLLRITLTPFVKIAKIRQISTWHHLIKDHCLNLFMFG